jgi:hypothetical protein
MRVTVVEGTPEEIRQTFPHLANPNGSATAVTAAATPGGGLPADVQQVLDQTRPVEREAVRRFVDAVTEWAGVHVVAGQRRAGGYTAYVRFHRRGAGAAFAYLYPRRLYVRPHLPAEELAGARFATVRGGEAASGNWSRNLALSPQEAWDEALKFTRRAYDAAGE